MTDQKENITNKDIIISRVTENTSNESKLVNKIMGQIKDARKKPRVRLNIDEKQLQFHLNELIKQWSERKTSQIINKFLEEVKSSLQRKENILFHGYFGLKVRRSAARQARNPQNGELITIKEKNRLSFRESG
ncbi:4186_t:CDS:2 [Funneliformis geosporum]|nr:4186_t:CDS:2 [Funneliformis geosporum]